MIEAPIDTLKQLANNEALNAKSILRVTPSDETIRILAQKNNILTKAEIETFTHEFKKIWFKQVSSAPLTSSISLKSSTPRIAKTKVGSYRLNQPSPIMTGFSIDACPQLFPCDNGCGDRFS